MVQYLYTKKTVDNMKWTTLFFLMLLFSISACNDDNNFGGRTWQLTWEDKFDGVAGESPDASNWKFELGRGPDGDGWGNDELQTYTDKPENVSLDGQGNLIIKALSEGGFTSARIITKGLFEQRFGRFEAKIKLPYGPGIWPAFWLLGSNIETVGWPQCGEIDIMELKGQEPNIIHGSLHGPGYSKEDPITKSYGFEDDRFDLDFHLFAIEWDENSIDYYVDDVLYQRIEPEDADGEWVFDQPFYIILNVAVGGNYVGFPAPQTTFPQTMLVDWVRVYKEIE